MKTLDLVRSPRFRAAFGGGLVLVFASWAARSPAQGVGGARAGAPPTRVVHYGIVALGTEATAIDPRGDVVFAQGTQAWLFTPAAPNGTSGSTTPLGTLGGTISIGKSINALGHVAGFSTLASGSYRAFVYHDGVMTDVGTLGGNYSSATAINDAGQIVGFSYDASHDEHGFLWTPDAPNGATGSMIDVGTLGGEYSEALGLDPTGRVVGYAYTPIGAFHAFLRNNGALLDLGTLGGSYSKAEAIDGAGRIVGQAYLPGNAQAHACMWSGGTLQDLGNLGGSYSEALAIDPTGQLVVGTATVPGGPFLEYRAFLHANGRMRNLNEVLPPNSGWLLQRASGVNAQGQIVGQGLLNGQARGFLLTPH